jgi:cell wall assembly regulator SMI1
LRRFIFLNRYSLELLRVEQIWARIERWLVENAPAILSDMRPGASKAEIRLAEEQLGCIFPEPVREWFALHDGSESCALMEYWDLYSLSEVVSSWETLKDLFDKGIFTEFRSKPTGPIRKEWWRPEWVPLTGEPRGDHLCLDLAPARGGAIGQVISWVHDDSVRVIVAPTFTAWFEQLADGLEAGAYKVDREGVLVRIGGPEDQDAVSTEAYD